MTAPARGEAARAAWLPMRGIRIADFSTNMAGPFATMILAQLGADVVKVEPPEGDDARAWSPMVDDQSVTHRHMSAGKRGIVVDLKTAEGQRVALALAGSCQVLLQSMRPGVAERLGIGEAAVRAVNPDILYYDLSAFGDGPIGHALPGYDPLVQAFSGIMAMTGHEGSPPTRCAPSIIDLGTGQWIAMGVLAATLARARGSEVRSMSTALIDSAFSIVPYQATAARLTGRRPPKAGSGNPIAAPYQCYPASDGDLMIAAPSQRLWRKLAAALGAPELADDPLFRTVAGRSRNNAALTERIIALLATDGVSRWAERLAAAGIPVAKVQGLEEAVVGGIAVERQSFLDNDGVPLVRLPWLVDGGPVPFRGPAPRLGEHTDEVLRELGYSDERISALQGSGAVAGAPEAGPAPSDGPRPGGTAGKPLQPSSGLAPGGAEAGSTTNEKQPRETPG